MDKVIKILVVIILLNYSISTDLGVAVPIPGLEFQNCEGGQCSATFNGDLIAIEGVKDDVFNPYENENLETYSVLEGEISSIEEGELRVDENLPIIDQGVAIPIPGIQIDVCEQGWCLFPSEGEPIPIEGVKDDVFDPSKQQ